MTGAELIGCEVIDACGRTVGHVHDLVFLLETEDGPPRFELVALECGKAGIGHRLGYMRDAMVGPWPLKVLFRWMYRHSRVVEWSEVRRIDPPRIEIGKLAEHVHRSIDVLPA